MCWEQAAAPEAVTPETGASAETLGLEKTEARVAASILRSAARHAGANTSVRFMCRELLLERLRPPRPFHQQRIFRTHLVLLPQRLPRPGESSLASQQNYLQKCEAHVIIDLEMPFSTLAEANGLNGCITI
jgi:hypothetical protein